MNARYDRSPGHEASSDSAQEAEDSGDGSSVVVARISEIIDSGAHSHPETLRGRALAISRGTMSDQDLIDWYLEENAQQPTTRANYASQLRRLSWFAKTQLQVSSFRLLQREDWKTFVDYLKEPPASDIMEDKERKRKRSVGVDHEDWRPFRGALSPSSSVQAQRIVKNFYAWLADASIGALKKNPFGKVRAKTIRKVKSAQQVEHFIETPEWPYIFRALAEMPVETPMQVRAHARANWVISLARYTGLRASEIAAARSSMIKPSLRGGWHLEIVRKGGGEASKVNLNSVVMREWDRYRRVITASLADEGAVVMETDMPLVGQIQRNNIDQAMTRQAIWALIKTIFGAAADIAKAEGETHVEARLREVSPHWMRHTYAVQMVNSGADLRSTQDAMEHSSIATTSIYLHVDVDKRKEDDERMAAHAPKPPEPR